MLLRLRSQRSLCFVSVPLPLAVLLVCVLYCYFLVHEILPVHMLNRSITRFETGIRHKSISFAEVRIVSCDLRRGNQLSKSDECLVQHLLIYHTVQVANEKFRAYSSQSSVLSAHPLVCRSFVHSDRLAVDPNLVHNFAGIIGVIFASELDEPIALVILCDAVLGQVYVDDRTGLKHQFPDERIGAALVEVADIQSRLLVLFPMPCARHLAESRMCSGECESPSPASKI
jgi:hypothetical protein